MNKNRKNNSRIHSQHEERIVVGLHASREVIKVRPGKVTQVWLKQGAERSQDLKFFLDFAQK